LPNKLSKKPFFFFFFFLLWSSAVVVELLLALAVEFDEPSAAVGVDDGEVPVALASADVSVALAVADGVAVSVSDAVVAADDVPVVDKVALAVDVVGELALELALELAVVEPFVVVVGAGGAMAVIANNAITIYGIKNLISYYSTTTNPPYYEYNV
jgi:hypothetical protein